MITIQEFHTKAYPPRTKHNADSAQLTCAFAADMYTGGEMLTKKCAGLRYLGFDLTAENVTDDSYIAEWSGKIARYIKFNKVKTLNIAGNGIYTLVKHYISQKDVNDMMTKILRYLKDNTELEMIISGGQTGVDIAAAVAAKRLDFPCIITLPKGFVQRHEDGVDREFTRAQIENYIESMASNVQNRSKP